jgi:hypothetical protein
MSGTSSSAIDGFSVRFTNTFEKPGNAIRFELSQYEMEMIWHKGKRKQGNRRFSLSIPQIPEELFIVVGSKKDQSSINAPFDDMERKIR